MKQACKIQDVLTVVTGIMLERGADFQGVMDVLYPGIMTIGCAAMRSHAADEICRQHPKMREFCRVHMTTDVSKLGDFIQLAKIHFGETIEIDGPHEVSSNTISEAYAALRS